MRETNFKQTDLGWIPKDWDILTLGDLGEPVMCKRILKEQTTSSGDIPFFKIGTFGGQPDAYISKALYEFMRSEYSFPNKGDILISAAGTIGRLVIYNGKPSYFQDSNIVWINHSEKKILNPFLYYWLNEYKWDAETSCTISRLYNSTIKAAKIIVPPLDEQKHICNTLQDIDDLISGLKKLIEKKRAIKAGAMSQLLSGKLRLPGFSEPWEDIRIGDFSCVIPGATPSTDNPKYWNGTIRWMNSGELNLKYVREVENRITQLGYDTTSTHILPKYCVLLGLAGQGKTRGTAAINLIELCTNQSIAAILPSADHNPFFLYHLLDSKYQELRTISSGEGARGGLTKKQVEDFVVSLPNLEEQKAIAKVLTDMDEEISALEAKLRKYEQLKKGMMQQLLTGKIRLVSPNESLS